MFVREVDRQIWIQLVNPRFCRNSLLLYRIETSHRESDDIDIEFEEFETANSHSSSLFSTLDFLPLPLHSPSSTPSSTPLPYLTAILFHSSPTFDPCSILLDCSTRFDFLPILSRPHSPRPTSIHLPPSRFNWDLMERTLLHDPSRISLAFSRNSMDRSSSRQCHSERWKRVQK